MEDRIGQQLGNYRLTSLLGRGGFADVYHGEHIYLKTHAAVKVLQTRLTGAEDLDYFIKEAQTVARLSHPHIVRILDFGVDAETPFLVMDYAPNGTLRQRHKRGERVPLENVVQYTRQLADALQLAHDERLIHRDVKPENMLIGRRQEILLSDFGIALVAQSSRYQSTQDVVGTVAYMSPEQIQGKPRPASDQYSLGIVVYEWLSGERPFSGSFIELCTQHVVAPVPSLHARIPALSSDVEQVVLTALAKDPKQRFGNVQAFANALEQASRGRLVPDQAHIIHPPSNQAEHLAQGGTPAAGLQTPQAINTPESLARGSAPSPGPQLPPNVNAPGVPTPQYATPERGNSTPNPYLASITPPPPRLQEKATNVWGLDRGQLLAMLIGVVLYTGISVVLARLWQGTLYIAGDYSSALITPLSLGDLQLPSPYGILYGVVLSVPLFFAARFGPWVGLVVTMVGGFLGDYFSMLSFTDYNVPLFWYLYLAYALFGFIAGLAYLKTQGRYNRPGYVGLAILLGLSAILMSNLVIDAGDAHVLSLDSSGFLAELYILILGDLLAFLLFAFALIISENRAQRRTGLA
ncbi:MAG TPA: protein kinase [Ktedonobacteraceae bacterium]|nr:protein kinase [Ktedonobacteraceae bacterium]